jgi:hypothetical protein
MRVIGGLFGTRLGERRPRPAARIAYLDSEYVADQLLDSIARHPGRAFGRVPHGCLVLTAQWVEAGWWSPARWRVRICVAGVAREVVVFSSDANLRSTVVWKLEQLARRVP